MTDWIEGLVNRAREKEIEERKGKEWTLHAAQVIDSRLSDIVKNLVEEIEKQISIFNGAVLSDPTKVFKYDRIPSRGIAAHKDCCPSVHFTVELDRGARSFRFAIQTRLNLDSSPQDTNGYWRLALDNEENVYLSSSGNRYSVDRAVQLFLEPLLNFALRLSH
jgi:hypothetical protein